MLGPIDLQSYLFVALIFLQLELFFPLRKQKILRKHWQSDATYIVVNGIIIQLGLFFIVAALMASLRLVTPHAVAAAVQSQPIWLQAIEVVFVADLGFYAAHRAFHAIPFLWRFHAVHHSIEELDWLAAYRVHAVDQIITKTCSYLPIYALGFSTPAVIIFLVFFKWHSVLIHTNSRVSFGPLKWIVATPQFHHWHHANEVAAFDKNFAGQLSLIDWLGGTLHLPKGMPEKYGSDTPVPAFYHQQLVYPLLRKRLAIPPQPAPMPFEKPAA